MKYFMEFDASGNYAGNGIAVHDTLPPGAVECTAAQYAGGNLWALKNGIITAISAAAPTLAQQATAAIGAGLTITSASTPALNGTYAVASGVPFGREDIGTEAQFVSTFSEFTNGAQTLEWPLLNGTFVTFPSTASFMNFAKAAAQYYAAVKAVVAAGQGSFPSNQVTIP